MLVTPCVRNHEIASANEARSSKKTLSLHRSRAHATELVAAAVQEQNPPTRRNPANAGCCRIQRIRQRLKPHELARWSVRIRRTLPMVFTSASDTDTARVAAKPHGQGHRVRQLRGIRVNGRSTLARPAPRQRWRHAHRPRTNPSAV